MVSFCYNLLCCICWQLTAQSDEFDVSYQNFSYSSKTLMLWYFFNKFCWSETVKLIRWQLILKAGLDWINTLGGNYQMFLHAPKFEFVLQPNCSFVHRTLIEKENLNYWDNFHGTLCRKWLRVLCSIIVLPIFSIMVLLFCSVMIYHSVQLWSYHSFNRGLTIRFDHVLNHTFRSWSYHFFKLWSYYSVQSCS